MQHLKKSYCVRKEIPERNLDGLKSLSAISEGLQMGLHRGEIPLASQHREWSYDQLLLITLVPTEPGKTLLINSFDLFEKNEHIPLTEIVPYEVSISLCRRSAEERQKQR